MPSTLGVIIPAYNSGNYIDQTLASLASQLRQPDQVIVVNDASTDDTPVRAQAWADVLPLVVLNLETNGGLGAARNAGVSASTTELIAFLDADDILLPDHLSTCVAMREEVGGIAIGDCINWMPEKAVGRRSWFERQPLPRFEDQYKALLRGNRLTMTAVLARSDFDRIGGFSELRTSEDWDFWVRAARAKIRISATTHTTWLYRQVEKNLSKGLPAIEGQLVVLQQVLTDAGEIDTKFGRCQLKHARCRVHLYRAFEHARNGASSEARAEARSAFRGDIRTVARAMVMRIAPILGVRIYDRIRTRPKRQVR